jgi:cytochrome P450
MLGNPFPLLTEQYQRFGPIFRLSAAGRAFTVVAGPEANLFLAQADGDILDSEAFWHDYGVEWRSPRMLTGLYGEDHARQRSIHKGGMAKGVILARLPDVVAVTRRYTEGLQPGQRVPLLGLIQRIVSEQLGELLAGRGPGLYLEDVRLAIRYTLNALVLKQWPRLVLATPAYRRARARVYELARALVAERRARPAPEEPEDLIDALVAARAGNPAWFGEDDLLFATLSPYVAGLDTVANTITFTLYALLTHPELYEEATAEADRVLGAGPLSADSVRSLRVLHGVVMETLRLYPVAAMAQRRARRAFVFAGHAVEGGATVLLAGGVAHYLPTLYPEPLRFDIARFAAPRSEHRQKGAFAPFGVGPHTCLGAGLAEVQMIVTTAALLHTVLLAPEAHRRQRVRLDPTMSLGPGFRAEVVGQRQTRQAGL